MPAQTRVAGRSPRSGPDAIATNKGCAVTRTTDVTIEVCDGLPSHVEAGVVTSDQYCPWSAKVIAVDQV